jgi:hypothetical protein
MFMAGRQAGQARRVGSRVGGVRQLELVLEDHQFVRWWFPSLLYYVLVVARATSYLPTSIEIRRVEAL